MNVIKHNRFVIELEGLVDHDMCDLLVENVENSDAFKNNTEEKSKVRHNRSIVLSNYEELAETDELTNELFGLGHYHHDKHCIFSKFLNSYYSRLSCDYFYRYYDSNDYYDWHVDKDEFNEYVFSYILYLNDDFEGGDTIFLADQLRVKPKKGSMLCFPCDFSYIHKSTPIKSGKKKIIWTCMGRPIETYHGRK